MKRILMSLAVLLLIGQQPLRAEPDPIAPVRAMLQDYQNEALINRFYSAFREHNGPAMAACYHPQATFNDPVFGDLSSAEVKAMWPMLLEVSKGKLNIDYHHVNVQQGIGGAQWDARYVFSATGFPVINHIQARFEFKDGLIYRHQDTFDIQQWRSQAFGIFGTLFGSLLQDTIAGQARKSLQIYMQKI